MPVTRLSSKGQLVLPKPVRDALGLQPGDELWIEVEDGSIRIVPRRKRGLEEVLARLPGHRPRRRFENAEALLEAEREETRKRWKR